MRKQKSPIWGIDSYVLPCENCAMQGDTNTNEIRVCGQVLGLPLNCGHWHPDSPGNRKMLEVILASNLEIHGAGTHWIEVRALDALPSLV